MTTVQAPQSPSLQPSLVPVQRASSRSQSSTVRVGAAPSTLDDGAAMEEADRTGRHAEAMVYTRFACHLAAPRPSRRRTPPPAPRRGSPSTATCSTSAPSRPGATSTPPAVRFRPDHWLLVERGRVAAVQAEAARRRLAAPRPRRLPRPARLRRHARAQPADRRHRQLRQRAARLADDAHLPRRGAPRRSRRTPKPPRRISSTRCSPTGPRAAVVFPTVHAGSVDALFAAAEARGMRVIAGKVLMDRNAPADLRRRRRRRRARHGGADRPLARSRRGSPTR